MFKIYGVTQIPDSKDHVMVLQKYHEKYVESYCKTCIEEYTDIKYRWCKPCQIDYLRNYFTNWSGNEKIDEFIQEMQLKINDKDDKIFEWIPYDQFIDTKEIVKNIYSALWKNGPLMYDLNEKRYIKVQNEEVILKLCNSQNMINDFLNKV
jgi:hypothetical protein